MKQQSAHVVAKARVLIRHSVDAVFASFVNPSLITKFWLSHASGQLEQGKTVRWDFMVPGATVDSEVLKLEHNKLIFIRWSDGSTVEFVFEPTTEGTIVEVKNEGFSGDLQQATETAIESTQGFTLVLCDLKTLLEGGRSTQLVKDKAHLIQLEMQKNSKS